MKKKTILYITELFPYPPTSGAKIKSINTIQTLSKKFNITLVCFSNKPVLKKNIIYVNKFVKDLKVFTLPNLNQPPQNNIAHLIKNYLKLNPYFLYQFHSNKAKIYIGRLIEKIKPEIIHIDHINMAQYLPKNKKQSWILEEHNVEHQLAWTKFLHFPGIKKTKLHLFIEYLLIYLFEKKTLKKFDYIFSISKFDKNILIEKFGTKNISTQKLVYPQSKKILNKNHYKKRILFVGDITWLPNKLAVKWFLKIIFPIILKKEPSVIFDIVGEIENDFSKRIKSLSKNISIHGFQTNIDKFFENASLFVMPFSSGGGVRIKALTAFAHKLPVVTTKLGVQGLEAKNLKDYLLAKNPREFAKLCLILLRNKKINQMIGINGSNYLKDNHKNKNNFDFIKKYLEVTQ